jgi:hypothetical protein
MVRLVPRTAPDAIVATAGAYRAWMLGTNKAVPMENLGQRYPSLMTPTVGPGGRLCFIRSIHGGQVWET